MGAPLSALFQGHLDLEKNVDTIGLLLRTRGDLFYVVEYVFTSHTKMDKNPCIFTLS